MRIENVLRDWRVAWLLVLLPIALFLPAMPIDETRYLSVAWEMRHSGDYLLLHLNGAPYADKGPLLFWLINLAWSAAGLNVWIVRLGVLLASLVSLILFEQLARRLDPDRGLARRATLLFGGMICVTLFARHRRAGRWSRAWPADEGAGRAARCRRRRAARAMVERDGARAQGALVWQRRPRHSRRHRHRAGLGDCGLRRAGFLGRDRRAPDGRPRCQEFRARAAILVVPDGVAADAVAMDADTARAVARAVSASMATASAATPSGTTRMAARARNSWQCGRPSGARRSRPRNPARRRPQSPRPARWRCRRECRGRRCHTSAPCARAPSRSTMARAARRHRHPAARPAPSSAGQARDRRPARRCRVTSGAHRDRARRAARAARTS